MNWHTMAFVLLVSASLHAAQPNRLNSRQSTLYKMLGVEGAPNKPKAKPRRDAILAELQRLETKTTPDPNDPTRIEIARERHETTLCWYTLNDDASRILYEAWVRATARININYAAIDKGMLQNWARRKMFAETFFKIPATENNEVPEFSSRGLLDAYIHSLYWDILDDENIAQADADEEVPRDEISLIPSQHFDKFLRYFQTSPFRSIFPPEFNLNDAFSAAYLGVAVAKSRERWNLLGAIKDPRTLALGALCSSLLALGWHDYFREPVGKPRDRLERRMEEEIRPPVNAEGRHQDPEAEIEKAWADAAPDSIFSP